MPYIAEKPDGYSCHPRIVDINYGQVAWLDTINTDGIEHAEDCKYEANNYEGEPCDCIHDNDIIGTKLYDGDTAYSFDDGMLIATDNMSPEDFVLKEAAGFTEKDGEFYCTSCTQPRHGKYYQRKYEEKVHHHYLKKEVGQKFVTNICEQCWEDYE